MAPAEDTTGIWDSFIGPTLLDGLHSASGVCPCPILVLQPRARPPLDRYAHIGNVNDTRVLPAGESCDDVFLESSFAIDSLSPLTLYSPWNNLGSVGCTPFGPEMLEGHKDSSEDEEVDPLFKTLQWSSPTSTDTDLDESPSSMFSSIASLSPEDQFRHYALEDDDSPYATSSTSMLHDNNLNTIYHPLEQYPSNAFDLYHPDTDSDGSLSPLSPLSQPSSLPPFTLASESNYCSTLPSPPSPLQTFGLGLSPYLPVHSHAERSFLYNPYADHEIGIVPSSPSRRRSMDLPSFDDDSHHDTAFARVHVDAHANGRASQLLESDQERTSPPARSTWLNLPGAETDDSLVCPELALKGYDPEPASTVSSAPPAGLLLWDADIEPRLYGSAKDPARPPSPEDFVVDPNVVARIAGDEGEKVYWLRERTAAARKEKWEKEKYGELSALLRLKLEALSALDRKDAENSTADPEVVPIPPPSEPSSMPAEPCSGSADIPPESCSTPTPSSVTINTQRASTAPASFSTLAAHHLKPRITSMAQLVANMVFHRQQQPEISGRSRRAPRRAQSQLIESASSCTRSPPPAKTPKSPLRQMVLPESDEDDDGSSSSGSSESILEDGTECESPLPLSPLALAMMPLPLAFEEKHE